jgi:hypothetical protein
MRLRPAHRLHCIGRPPDRLLHKDCDRVLGLRSDKGVPFISPNALFNFPKLSVWWLCVAVKRTAFGRLLKRNSS